MAGFQITGFPQARAGRASRPDRERDVPGGDRADDADRLAEGHQQGSRLAVGVSPLGCWVSAAWYRRIVPRAWPRPGRRGCTLPMSATSRVAAGSMRDLEQVRWRRISPRSSAAALRPSPPAASAADVQSARRRPRRRRHVLGGRRGRGRRGLWRVNVSALVPASGVRAAPTDRGGRAALRPRLLPDRHRHRHSVRAKSIVASKFTSTGTPRWEARRMKSGKVTVVPELKLEITKSSIER